MKLGDHPEMRKLADGGGDPTKCPKCGKRKNETFALCRDCDRQDRGGGGRQREGRPGQGATKTVPDKYVLDTFYGEDGKLHSEIFFELPEGLSGGFHKTGLKPTALRGLYQGFLSFAAPLRDRRMDFATARERFGVFFVERVVRQTKRGHLPELVHDFMDRHRKLALSDRKEMLGLFRYITNVLCYFGDQESKGGGRR